MALEQMMAGQPPQEAQQAQGAQPLTEDEEQDLRIGIMMGEDLLEQGGYDAIKAALGSKDPAQAIGQFFVMLIQKLDSELPEDVKLSKRIYLAKGGWLEEMMDLIIDELGVDPKVTDRAEIYVADAFSQMARRNAGQQQAPAPAAPAPAPGGMV